MPKDTRQYRYDRAKALAFARQGQQRDVGEIAELVSARETIIADMFKEEADLNSSAYLNYRYLSAYKRTELFAKQYQAWYASHQLNYRGRIGKRVKDRQLTSWSRREIAGFWQARRHADALGIPYERYFIGAFHKADALNWKKLPAPNQLYTPEILEAVQDYWVTIQRDRRVDLLPNDRNPRFFAENFIGDKVQVEALDAIQKDIEGASGNRRAGLLCRYMRQERLISESEARLRFGDELVDAALEERLMMPARPDGRVEDLEPSNPGCFGMYEGSSHPQCMQCPVASACHERALAVDQALVDRFGTVDVRAGHERELARIRKQRQRKLDREGATMTLQEQKRVLRWLGDRAGPQPIPKGRGKVAGPETAGMPEGPAQGRDRIPELPS